MAERKAVWKAAWMAEMMVGKWAGWRVGHWVD